MSLKIENIQLTTWRNFQDLRLEFAPGLTVLVGPNAVGKTNTIEALQYLTSASSFRKPSPKELIYQGTESSSIKAKITGDGRIIDVEMQVKERSRKFFKNGKAVQSSDFIGTLLSILFCPDDLLLIKGSASKRRDEIDNFGIQVNSGYRKIYSTYMRSIEQRNHLLKDGITGTLLDSWDESVALGAATLLQHRARLFKNLSLLVTDIYKEVVSSETLDCFYISSLFSQEMSPFTSSSIDYICEIKRDELTHSIEELLHNKREEELRRGQTFIGPHRDDISFTLDGREARTFGSQGQQRSIVLAWKMAEVKFCEQLFGNSPLLLLDDVMSELDESRRTCITNFINKDIQTIITTTNLDYFNKEQLSEIKVVSYG